MACVIVRRFHILCSYLFCEEDVSVFDGKMNKDALLGHLQSLRQLYLDLSSKVRKFCAC